MFDFISGIPMHVIALLAVSGVAAAGIVLFGFRCCRTSQEVKDVAVTYALASLLVIGFVGAMTVSSQDDAGWRWGTVAEAHGWSHRTSTVVAWVDQVAMEGKFQHPVSHPTIQTADGALVVVADSTRPRLKGDVISYGCPLHPSDENPWCLEGTTQVSWHVSVDTSWAGRAAAINVALVAVVLLAAAVNLLFRRRR